MTRLLSHNVHINSVIAALRLCCDCGIVRRVPSLPAGVAFRIGFTVRALAKVPVARVRFVPIADVPVGTM